jgi:sialic acid synthase SpsE
MRIGRHHIGKGEHVYVIFEVASTHGGDFALAQKCVEEAARVGADAVKFQLFMADEMIAPLTEGLKETYEYFKANETPRDWFPKLKALCDEKGIDLLCTPFSRDAATFLDAVGVPAVKIASGEMTNLQLLGHVAKLGKPVILSTGMATMDEVRRAVDVVRMKGVEIILLQSVSVYPTRYEDANVSAMDALGKAFDVPVGYSDNGSEGLLVPLLAVARGASMIEKHVTLKKERGDIDDVFSMSIDEFEGMVERIRSLEGKLLDRAIAELRKEFGSDVDVVLGDGVKKPATHGTEKTSNGDVFLQTETDERHWARRGVYPSRHIRKGEKITEDMLVLLRPDVGISSLNYETAMGKEAGQDLQPRQPILLRDGMVWRFTPMDIKDMYADDGHFAASLTRYWNFA